MTKIEDWALEGFDNWLDWLFWPQAICIAILLMFIAPWEWFHDHWH